MEVTKQLELIRIEELKIVQNVRLVHNSDLNHIQSRENLRVQFEVSGDVKGAITCHLLLDGIDLNPTEKNIIYPLFTEAMNILIGRQISRDDKLGSLEIKLSPPKINLNPISINTKTRAMIQKYDLELEGLSYQVLNEYSLTAIN